MITLAPHALAKTDYFNYIFFQGGLTSWMLVAMSVAVLAWVLIMLAGCRRQGLCPPALHNQLVELLGDGDAAGAARLLAQDGSVLGRMVEAGLEADAAGEPPDRVDAAVAKAGADQFTRWSYRLGYLTVGAAVAPMLGLLGTVIGMIEAFASLGIGEHVTQQSELASAIAKALITTYEGLVIAIPTLTVFALLRHRLGLIMLEASARTDALLRLWRQARPRAAGQPGQAASARDSAARKP